MTTKLSFLIRDGLEKDVVPCLELDRTYETSHVWQMKTVQDTGQWQVMFNTERLPRALEIDYAANGRALWLALPPEQCFLVAVSQDDHPPEVLGYLAMQADPLHQAALVYQMVVSRPYRRCGIGSRLLKVAHRWAQEHQLNRLIIEIQTQNYPGITFFQNAGFSFCGFNDRYLPNQEIALFFTQSVR